MTGRLISTHFDTPAIQRGGWLDALRFIVACLIVLHHFQGAGPIALAEGLHPTFEHTGFLLTNFFLMDSGYVLMRVYGAKVAGGRMSPGDFFARRFLRVVPAHLIVLASLVILVTGSTIAGLPPRNPEWFAWDQLAAQATLTQGFGVYGGLGWNAPTWSISALIGCYLAFPWMLKTMRGWGPWTALAAGVGVYLLANETTWALFGYPVYQMPMGLGFFRAVAIFFLGMCLAVVSERVWIAPRLAAVVGVLAATVFFTLQFFGKNALASIGCIGLIILAAGAIPVVKRSRLVEQLALVSFSVFITNEVTRIAFFGVVNALESRLGVSETGQWALWAISLPLAIGAAVAFHYVIDTPIQTRIKGWLDAKRRRPAVTAEPAIVG